MTDTALDSDSTCDTNHFRFNTSKRRILYKISGEALMGDRAYGYDVDFMRLIAEDIKEVTLMGFEVCLVVGGGNIYRGIYGEKMGMDRAVADHMGMLATIMNGLALQNMLKKADLETRVMSAIPVNMICEPYIRRKAMRHLEKGRVVIFVSGIGSPFFTTDTTAILRSLEMDCAYMLKGTGVNGVYSDDPRTNPDAVRYDKISYQEMIEKNLKVMDMAAVSLARDKDIPIVVFSLKQTRPLSMVLSGKCPYTLISP